MALWLLLLTVLLTPASCADDLGCSINEARITAGLMPLAASSSLAVAAQQHAGEIAARGQLSHQSADGSWPWDRATAAGHPSGQVGEVLAVTTGAPADVLRGLLHSTEHRAILLDGDYQVVGVGMSERDGRRWWVVDLGVMP